MSKKGGDIVHEGKHGILDDLNDLDDLFGGDQKETDEKENQDDPNHDGHQHEHDHK
jgi:hypothetical protein